ncbi:tRNA lysidine(34) synthetase TilS [Levilactobacillus sp. HBUAS70063]|uniref:tRNA lysidine(34) synthetase TilS n=1 Tax=Levilactobacillus sp. HBUAS70063 TaxID=3109359 RepID=UPI003132A849
MSLEADFRRNCEQHGWNRPQAHVLLAVSAGVDSMVMLALFLRLPVDQRPRITVLHVNHQLREQSRTEEAFLKAWCAQRQVPVVTATWPLNQHPQNGVEAAARTFRYQFFAKQLAAQHADWVATAHQADEQVETILFKLIRGGQLDQLTGMAPSRPFHDGQLIRPLLPFRKQTLRTYAQQHRITWYEDATNHELVASRNRLRLQILPALRRENPQIDQHLLAYAEQLDTVLRVTDQTVTDRLAQVVRQSQPLVVDTARFLEQSVDLQRLLLTRLIKTAAPALTTEQAVLRSCQQLLANSQRPTGRVDLGAGWQLVKTYDTFTCQQFKNFRQNSEEVFSFMVVLNQWRTLGNGWQFGCFEPDATETLPTSEVVALTADQFPLRVRSWQPTDRLRLATGHHQTVRRALINAKVPREARSAVPVLVTAKGEVLAALGVKWSVLPPRAHTKNYHIKLQHE